MQNDFVKGKLKCERATRIIPNIKTLLERAHARNIPVFYCIDEHLPLDTYEMKLWGPHAMKGTIYRSDERKEFTEEIRRLGRDKTGMESK